MFGLMGLAAISVLTGCSKKADIAGTWEGSLDISSITAKLGSGPASLKLVYKIQKGSGDVYSGTMTSPDQSPQPIALDSVTRKDSTVTLQASQLAAKFEGTLSKDGNEISGTFNQRANSFPLTLMRTTAGG